jgi:hypothetical protein
MVHQQDDVTVAVPLPTVERLLREVERWTAFLPLVSGIERTGHERYLFTLAGTGAGLPMVCRVHPREHRVAWQSLSPGLWSGTLRLRALGPDHTVIRVSSALQRSGLLADAAEAVHADAAPVLVDCGRLTEHVLGRQALPGV